MKRRKFLRHAVIMSLGSVVATRLGTSSASAQGDSTRWSVRRVQSGDEAGLLALMKSCVEDRDSFHGLCNAIEWTETWAAAVVSERPRSIVITLDGVIVAYFDLPSNEPKIMGDETFDRHARAFWCGAAGVRLDLLGSEQSLLVFQQLLREAFLDAMSLGYEAVRAAAPWDHHPNLPRPFIDYPGLRVEAFVDDEGREKYLLEWRLAEAVQVLASSGSVTKT